MKKDKTNYLKSQTLTDVQNSLDSRGIAIQKVGVKDVEIPVYILQKDGRTQMVPAKVTMSVGLSEEQKGTHMSRFIIQLSENSPSKAFCYNLREFLETTRRRLQSDSAYLKMDFRYFINKKAPVSAISAPMAYQCSFESSLSSSGYKFALAVEVPIATLCPCSKAISDYGAHNQRAMVRANVALDVKNEHQVVWIEDLVESLDECASAPVYPILKREDEKYVTELAYDNPRFVEDVMRESIAILRGIPSVLGFKIEVEAFESIHGHNAWASQEEGSEFFS